ncbi:H(+)/Cl(-) exchange transporter ClcA [soil metagenome]
MGLAAGAGIAAGVVAVVFRVFVDKIEEITHQASSSLSAVMFVLFGAIAGGLAGWLTERFCPEGGGSGIPQTKAAILGIRPMRARRVLPIKLGAGLLALASGMSLGREGPTIHMGAATADLFGEMVRAPRRTRRTLLAAGAGAGLAAAFNAPLAGFLFVMEEMRREMSPTTYGTALVGSVVAVGVARLALGQAPSFSLSEPSPIPLSAYWAVGIVGVVAALLGVAFNRLLLLGLAVRTRLKISRAVAGAIVGAASVLLLIIAPQLGGGGHGLAETALNGGLTSISITVLGLLLIGKLLATVASYATGVPGGIFAPLLAMGALAGLVTGRLLHLAVPGLEASPQILATLGMAATLSSAVRAPLTSVVLIIEMTGQYHHLFALMGASFVAYLGAELLHDEPIYEALFHRDLKRNDVPEEHEGEVIELFVEPGASWEGRRIATLGMAKGLTIATIERDGKVIAPGGDTVIRSGDHLTIVLGAATPRSAITGLMAGVEAP